MVDASRELELLIDNLDEAEVHKQNVQANKKRADKLTHETIDLLHKTFITPIDRDEIHKFITTMDDILDLMEDVATAISLYDVHAVTSEKRASSRTFARRPACACSRRWNCSPI